jgi:hypothetical protein
MSFLCKFSSLWYSVLATQNGLRYILSLHHHCGHTLCTSRNLGHSLSFTVTSWPIQCHHCSGTHPASTLIDPVGIRATGKAACASAGLFLGLLHLHDPTISGSAEVHWWEGLGKGESSSGAGKVVTGKVWSHLCLETISLPLESTAGACRQRVHPPSCCRFMVAPYAVFRLFLAQAARNVQESPSWVHYGSMSA